LTPDVDLAISVGLDQQHIREAQPVLETHIGEITMPGILMSTSEVTDVSKHGFWLLLGDEQLLLCFEQFPLVSPGHQRADISCRVAGAGKSLLALIG